MTELDILYKQMLLLSRFVELIYIENNKKNAGEYYYLRWLGSFGWRNHLTGLWKHRISGALCSSTAEAWNHEITQKAWKDELVQVARKLKYKDAVELKTSRLKEYQSFELGHLVGLLIAYTPGSHDPSLKASQFDYALEAILNHFGCSLEMKEGEE